MPTVAELKKMCKSKGIKGYSKLKKKELEKLCQGEAKKSPAKARKTPVKKAVKKAAKKPSNKDCKESSRAKYKGRPGPPIPANDCKEGEIKKGNNGKKYIAKKTKKGYLRWVKVEEDNNGENVFKDLKKILNKTEKKINIVYEKYFDNIELSDDYKNEKIKKALEPLIKKIREGLKKLDKKNKKNYDENMKRLSWAYMNSTEQAISDSIYDHFGDELINYI